MIWLFALLMAAPAPRWQHDWNAAFRMAKEQHRLVLVHYTQTEARCKPCWQFKQTLDQPDVQQRMSDFVLLRLDPEISAIPLAHRYSTPAAVVFDAGERERFRIEGFHAVKADDWHRTWGNIWDYPFFGPLEEIRKAAPKFVEASELFDQKKDLEAYQLLAATYEQLQMPAHARAAKEAADKLVKSFSSP